MRLKRTAVAVLISLLILGGILTGCEPGGKTTTPPTIPTTEDIGLSAVWCQEIVWDFKDIQPGKIPDNLTKNDSSKTGGEFDVSEYFSVLKHLSMEKGYVLDYVYSFDGMGGGPILYVRPENQEPYKNYEEFAKAANQFQRPENDNSLVWMVMGETSGKSGNKIKIDGTNEGFFEYTVLQMLGEQFYLFWHANYNDADIICEVSAIEDVIVSIENSGLEPITNGFKKDARKLNVKPIVEINGDMVTVKLVVFSKWGGFSRFSYTMYRNYPHMVIGFQDEVLLEYECGMMF